MTEEKTEQSQPTEKQTTEAAEEKQSNFAVELLENPKLMNIVSKFQKEFEGTKPEVPIKFADGVTLFKLNGGMQLISRDVTALMITKCDIDHRPTSIHTKINAEKLLKAIKVLGKDSQLFIGKEPSNPVILADEDLRVGIIIAPIVTED